MADHPMQEQAQGLRSGFFDRGAFRQKGRSILVLKTAVAGMQFYVDDNSDEGRALLASLTPGTELHLFRDTDNEHDKWAISVYTSDDRELGYVTRFKNETIARLMDYGKGVPRLCGRAAGAAQGRRRGAPYPDDDGELQAAVFHLYG